MAKVDFNKATSQSVQTQNMFDLTIGGNTIGAGGALISSGTLTLAGGNNISLSQDGGNAITIEGAIIPGQSIQSYNILSAGTQLANTTGTVLFQNSNSVSFGMSNNSVITAEYELKSHSANYHTGIIGSEAQISFNTLSGHDHDGVDSKLIITPQYLEVSEVAGVGESGKQFTSIATAIAAAVAGGAGSAKPYVIRVYPGTYTEPQLIMVPYVAVIGSGMFNTIITASDLTNHFIIGATNSYIRNCAVVGPTTDFMAAFYHNKISSSPFTVQDVLIRQGYYGVLVESASTGGNVHCINVNNWYNGTIMHTFMHATNFGTIVAISSGFMCGPLGKISRGFACVGPNAEIYMDLCNFRNEPKTTLPAVPNDALFVDDGGKVKLVACTFSIGTNAIHIGANGTGGYVIAVGCNIRNEVAMGYIFTTDILMDNAGTLQYTGSCTKSKITITNPAAVTFSANFTDSTTGEEGSVTVGEAWLGFTVANSIPLRDYGLTAYSSGWRSGGAVTRAGGLNVSVALGSGYINTGTGVTRISWAAVTPVLCLADTEEWIYVDSAGTVTVSPVEPVYSTVILLATVRTDAAYVAFLSNHRILLQQTVPTIYEWIEEVFGPISISGCTVTQTAGGGNELKVDFTTGKYFSGLNELTLGSTSPITFTYWYRKVGSSGWNAATPGGGGSNFDTTQYDNNSGALVALPGGKYKKDRLYVVKNDVGTEFHVIYGQRYFDTLDQAQADTGFEIPDAFDNYALKLSGIVVLSGAGVIASIVDDKEKFVSAHNELKDLQGGNSATSQYYHLDYADYSIRNQKIVASLLTAGNTAGAMAVISTGTMYLAGGNNVTLSQNVNSVTISGPNMAIAAGGATITGSTFTFGDTNGISFQISNGSIVGSAGAYLTSQSNQALSGSNTSFTFQTATFGNSNGLSFYVTNGSMVGSYTVPVQSVQTDNILSPLAIIGNTAGTNYTLTEGAYSLSAGQNITLSQNSSSTNVIVLSVNTANLLGTGATASFQFTSANTKFVQEWELEGVQTAGTTSSSQGSRLYLSGGNMMTLSGNSNTIVFSMNSGSLLGTGATASFRFTSDDNQLQFTSANTKFVQEWELEGLQTAGTTSSAQGSRLYLSGGNMMTLSGNSNTIIFSVNTASLLGTGIKQTVGLTNTTAGGGTGGTAGGASGNAVGYVFVAGSNVTLSQSLDVGNASGTLSIYAANPSAAGIAAIGNTASSDAFTSGSVIFSASTNITINTSANGASQYIQLSVADPAAALGVSAIANSETTYTSGLMIFSEYTNITISSSVNGGSQYYRFSVVDPGGDAIRAISGSNTSTSASTITFGSSNNMHFYITNGSMVGSFSESTHDHPYVNTSVSSEFMQIWELEGVQTAGTTSSSQGSILYLSGGNMMTLSGNNNTIVFSMNSGSLLGTGATASFQFTSDNTKFVQEWELVGTNTFGTTSSAQGSRLYLSGDQMMNISGNSNTIVFSVNSFSLLGTGATASFRFTSDDGQLQFTSANTKFVQGWELEGVQTAGTTSSSQGTQLYLSGGNMMTLSGNSNTIVFSMNSASLLGTGATASFQFTSANTKFVQGWELEGVNTAGTTSSSQGTQLYLSGGNQMTLSGNSNTIVFSAGGIAGIAGSGASTVTDGTVQFANSNGITFGLNGSTMTASHDGLTSQSTAPSGLYATNIATTFTSGNIGFSGSNNITVSTAAQAIIISGANTHAVQVGISSIGATDTTYTSGGVSLYGSGIVSISSTTGQGFVISAPGVVSINGYSSLVTISAGNLIAISNAGGATNTINIHNVLSSSAIVVDVSAASSAGSLASRFALADHAHRGVGTIYASGANGANSFYGPMTIATGNTNLTLSTGASALSIYGPSGGGVAIANSQSTFTGGTVNLLEGGGAITIASSAGGQSFKFSVPATSSLVQAGNVSISTAGSTITISGIRPTASFFEIPHGIAIQAQALSQGSFFVQPIDIPYYMTVTRADILMFISNSASAAGTVTVNLGAYVNVGASIGAIYSTVRQFSYNSTMAASSYTAISGTRYRSISLASWTFRPGNYWLGIGVSVGTDLTSGTYSLYGRSSLSIDPAEYAGGNLDTNFGLPGVLNATTNAPPDIIHRSNINRTGSAANAQPWIMFQGTQ